MAPLTWYDWCIANWGTKWNAYGYDDGANRTISPLAERQLIKEMIADKNPSANTDQTPAKFCWRYTNEMTMGVTDMTQYLYPPRTLKATANLWL